MILQHITHHILAAADWKQGQGQWVMNYCVLFIFSHIVQGGVRNMALVARCCRLLVHMCNYI